ncbi:acyl-CoA N-acyltransferase [Peniophora sp. CONT]|nr:acyl-CoA N-acyltransferase [Peniophora sp. CONT]
MSTNIFESARLTYRGIKADDFDAFLGWWDEVEQQIGANGGDIIPKGESAKERNRTLLKEGLPLFVLPVEKETGEVVGQVHLRSGTWKLEYEAGLNIRKEFWGKGYATEIMTWVVQHAFNYMAGVHRITVGAFSSNPAAIAVYKKVGFVQEGVKRKARFAAGKWDDVIEMAILEDEWKSRLKLE